MGLLIYNLALNFKVTAYIQQFTVPIDYLDILDTEWCSFEYREYIDRDKSFDYLLKVKL